MITICKIKFGSHLYGTDTPESDIDYKGVFLPSKEQILLGKIPKSINENTKKSKSEKNTSKDIDCEMYSLHYFLHLACEGETVALDMLHAPREMHVLTPYHVWDKIISERYKFYTKNLKAFIEYARRQASKYGIKGSRLNDAKRVLAIMEAYKYGKFGKERQLKDIWAELPEGEHIKKLDRLHEDVLIDSMVKNPKERQYEVCGRKIGENSKLGYAILIVKKFYDNYGKRARQAAKNEGIDWKAVSHALRAAFQVKEILTEANITFPLREAEYLKKVKLGELDYTKEVAPRLDSLIDEVEELASKSLLPDKVDREYWDDFIIETIKAEYFDDFMIYP